MKNTKDRDAVSLGKKSHAARTKGMTEREISEYYSSLRKGKRLKALTSSLEVR